MLRRFTILPVIAAAGVIAGSGCLAFLAAALAAAAATWLKLARVSAATLYANLDPLAPDAEILRTAFQKALSLVRQSQALVRLRLTAFSKEAHPTFRLDLNRENNIEIIGGRRKLALKQSGVWLPDHPLPFVLPHSHSLTLLFEPCGPTRIRVSMGDCRPNLRNGHWLALAAFAAIACAADTGWLLAAVLGFAFQAYLLEQQAHSAPNDA